ncbi:MAG TPA: hypothetical protein VL588_09850, partial [Bdellovibrionota bacterium]|nr:hypothetical protein [Bdellovibrionota bacterium]
VIGVLAALALLLGGASTHALAAEACPCPAGQSTPPTVTPVPTFHEVAHVTARIQALQAELARILNSRRLATPGQKTQAALECMQTDYVDLAPFVTVHDITDVGVDSYFPYMQSLFLIDHYTHADVTEALQTLPAYQAVLHDRDQNAHLTAADRNVPVQGVTPCELARLIHPGSGNATATTTLGYFDHTNRRVYYNTCAPFQKAVATVVHELSHAYNRTEDGDRLHERYQSAAGRLRWAVEEGGPGAGVRRHNEIRFDDEIKAYGYGARADLDLMRSFPGLEPGVSSGTCQDAPAWMDRMQTFEDISGEGYPRQFSLQELAAYRARIGCPPPPH